MPSAMRRGYVLAIWRHGRRHLFHCHQPSSWAFTGVFAFAAGLRSATQSYGWRRCPCSVPPALSRRVPRGDSAFFLFVITVALRFAVRREPARGHACHIVALIIGHHHALNERVASTHLTTAQGESRLTIDLLGDNMSFLPQYRRFYGYR